MNDGETTPQHKIGVCCVTNPRDPKVWSRTPATICDLLEARQRLGPAFWGVNHKGLAMQARALWTATRYGRPLMARRFLHGRSLRAAHAACIVREIEASGIKHVIHFAADRYLPLPHRPAGVKNYLLIDSVRSYWEDADLPRAYLDEVNQAMREAYHQMDHVFCISEHARESLVKEYALPRDRTSVVGSGRGAIKPYGGAKDYGRKAILFAAKERFHDKGGGLVLDGFRIAQRKMADLKLWLVGDPNLVQAARGLANVTLHGFLPLDELQRLFEQASLYAMPALREPWGLVYLEALSCQTPILGLNRGAIPQFTGNGAYGFVARDASPDAIADALLDAFSDLGRLEAMGRAGQAFCLAEFTWDRTMDRIMSVIDAE